MQVLHVSGSHVPIMRRIIDRLVMRHLDYVTLCRWPSGMQVLHVSGSHVPIIRSSTQSNIHQVSH